ncbi:nucleotidyltransferase family protein [Paraburkholderia aspalathi]|uniref:nucleotidyltransferase family protein n=1 Tax=Paraburkholderia aspalathi TaxID=1324617 RepID=UPI0019094060|nr:nucleotidyltransferase family protein [Paraburkholderia aspalathi]MBK3844038.1 hypothetical protein [Paraburkholderia aspalathi]
MEHHLVQVVRKNRWNELILSRAAQLELEDWWLTAGCIAQSVWNFACERDIYSVNRFWLSEDSKQATL